MSANHNNNNNPISTEIEPMPMDEGSIDEGFGEFDEDQLFDPIQAFGSLFVRQDPQTAANETVAEILSDIRDSLQQGVKILYASHKATTASAAVPKKKA